MAGGLKFHFCSMLAPTAQFSAQMFSVCFLEAISAEPLLLSGVGGKTDSITIVTVIAFSRDDGELVRVRGSFGLFTDAESADLSVLGRDVTNNFSVICDYPRQVIALLAPPHSYEIKASS